ncbi:MAG: AAA family ATPase [Candidatus Lokiarchaeota archaeon]|nr:AAA family ATPase [Candidatus Lokiarchaeota archaeon]
MIITISGLHGTGKSTIAKLLANNLGLPYYSTGQAFRDLAEDYSMTLEEFSDYVERNPEIDKSLDKKVIDMAKKGSIVIDSQLSGHLLKSIADYKIHLTCPLKVRVERMTARDQSSYDAKLNETTIREESELKRFNKLYNIDLSDNDFIQNFFDLIIDTESLSIEAVMQIILKDLEKIKPNDF